jgi:hypothetical protein
MMSDPDADADADEGEASEGDVGLADPAATSNDCPAEITRTWSSRVIPPLLALVSVIVNVLRTSRGLSQFLVDVLSPATQIASQHNPMLDHLGFSSGSELTAVSLPLRLYDVIGALGSGPIVATYIMVAVEVVWLFVGIAWSVRILQPSVSRELAAVAATVGTLGYALDGNNLATTASWAALSVSLSPSVSGGVGRRRPSRSACSSRCTSSSPCSSGWSSSR